MNNPDQNPITPPHSRDSEQSVLGGLLIDNTSWDNVSEILQPDDFYFKEHRLIYQAIQAKLNNNEPCDVVILSEYFKKNKNEDDTGGLAYLGSLAHNTPSAGNVKAYAEIVRERSDLRKLVHLGNETSTSALSPGQITSSEIIEQTERHLFQIADKRNKLDTGFKNNKALLKEAIDNIEELYHSDKEITGIATGFKEFDEMTSGLQPADFVIVAGRPSSGKTTFAINVAENVAMDGIGVAIFSLEMPDQQLTFRMLSSVGNIKHTKVKNGKFYDEDWGKLTQAAEKLSKATYHIDDTGGLSPSEMKSRLRRLQRKYDIGLVIVDYIQLMQIPGVNNSNGRVNEVSQISLGLKNMAKEFNVPVMALSQLNRNLEQRPNKRPVNSDLRESGSLEQDADLITFIYRDEIYNEDSLDKGMAELIIGKQRNGPLGTVKLQFQGEYSRFRNETVEW